MDWAFSYEMAKTTIGDLHKIRLNIDFVEPVYFVLFLGLRRRHRCLSRIRRQKLLQEAINPL
jgi:hypothetical protein